MKQKALAAAFAVVVLVVVAVAAVRARQKANAPLPSILEATKMIRIVQHDRNGLVTRQAMIRDPARVRALLDAVSAGSLESVSCAEDYSTSEVDLVLSGSDVYARRTLHLYRLKEPPAEVLLSSTSGCGRGTISNIEVVRGALEWTP